MNATILCVDCGDRIKINEYLKHLEKVHNKLICEPETEID